MLTYDLLPVISNIFIFKNTWTHIVDTVACLTSPRSLCKDHAAV